MRDAGGRAELLTPGPAPHWLLSRESENVCLSLGRREEEKAPVGVQTAISSLRASPELPPRSGHPPGLEMPGSATCPECLTFTVAGRRVSRSGPDAVGGFCYCFVTQVCSSQERAGQ